MTKLEIAVDANPNQDLIGRYGLVLIVNGSIRPMGPQTFRSEDAAIRALARSLASPRTNASCALVSGDTSESPCVDSSRRIAC